MKKTNLFLAFLFLAIITVLVTGCASDSTPGGLSVTTASLPGATIGTAYSQTLASSNGTGATTWSISVGALPAGLSLNASTGAIAGTPTTAGTASFTVMVTDSATPTANTATMALSIVVAAPGALTVTTTALPGATIGTAYSQTLASSGGTGATTWSISVGALPAGLSLNAATGAITGTPTTAGTASFTVTVTDSATPAVTATKALSIVVSAPGAALAVTTTALPGATIGTAYSQTLAASGGTTPYTWSISVGALPAGLSLNASTGAITGAPTTAGTVSFTVMATDSATPAGTATKALSIVVAASTPAAPAAPTSVVAAAGTNSVTITWPAVTGATSYNVYWSATTGVTTASTKVTGATSPYRQSRLTATPTWLAANTPYFFIVTAVNANGESTASTQVTATTSATDGVALYAADCAGCHSSLANSTKHDRTAAQNQAAINANTGNMGFLSTLTATQVQAISDVLVTGF